MAKTQPKQNVSQSLKQSERAILGACISAFTVAFALMGVFFTFSWIFFLLFVIDVVMLVTGGKLSDSTKRFALVVSVVGAIMALLFAATSHPWLFQ